MSLKGRLIIIVIFAMLGIPTSMLGLQWMGFKFLKQELDCITVVNDAMLNLLSNTEQGSLGSEMNKASNNLRTCVKGIDPRKGNVEFAVDQYKRYH
ncbi:hypothetical protein ACXNAL_00060 [Kluyvera ascorbata]